MDRREELLAEFPLAAAERSVRNVWRPSAACIYRNWLAHLAARKAARSTAGLPRSSTAPRVATGVVAATLRSGGEAPRRAPFIERRRSNDTSGLYSGARDRRMPAQREAIPAE
jgi:hypothetical protein